MSQHLQNAPRTSPIPSPSPSPNSQTRPTPIISQPLHTNPTSAPSPHSQSGTSIGASSLIPENIKWGSRDVDGRIWIRPAPGNNFDPEPRVRGAITKIFKAKFDGVWTSWYNVDEEMRDAWFSDFKALYKWLDKDEDRIEKSFNSRGSIALKNALFKVRSGEDKSGWIEEEYLKPLEARWKEDDKWQRISETNKQNRQAQEGHNAHAGGSISAREHIKKMKVELNRDPTLYELYERLHRPKGKLNEWLNEKQAKISEMFQSQLAERQQQSGEDIGEQSTQKFQDDVFLKVIGGLDKKGRALGLGSHAAVLKESLKDSSYKDATISEEISILKAELQQKNIVQENITRKLDRYEQMFKKLMRDKNIKALLDAPEEEAYAPEEEADYCNEEMGEAEMNDSLFH